MTGSVIHEGVGFEGATATVPGPANGPAIVMKFAPSPRQVAACAPISADHWRA